MNNLHRAVVNTIACPMCRASQGSPCVGSAERTKPRRPHSGRTWFALTIGLKTDDATDPESEVVEDQQSDSAKFLIKLDVVDEILTDLAQLRGDLRGHYAERARHQAIDLIKSCPTVKQLEKVLDV